MSLVEQRSFGGGIFRSPRAPAGHVYDAINALVDDNGVDLYKRGGTVYESVADSPGNIQGLADVETTPARTMLWDTARLAILVAGSPVSIQTAGAGNALPRIYSRTHGSEGIVFWPSSTLSFPNDSAFVAYAGSAKSANWVAGGGNNTTFTAGSPTATIVGGYLANVDAGMIVYAPAAVGQQVAVVKSVDSNTQITLTRPWTGSTGAVSASYMVAIAAAAAVTNPGGYIAVVPGPRLLVGQGTVLGFSNIGNPFQFDATDYHVLPAATGIRGLDAIGSNGVVFTTGGIWTISNLDLDLTDAAGNPQQRLERVEESIVLWADQGIARWSDSLVVPALDDIYLFSLDSAPVPISEGIRPLYREYVKAGYTLGTATLQRGHYYLPITHLNGWVDTLVCRLDLRSRDRRALDRRAVAWTRAKDGMECMTFASRSNDTDQPQRLLGAKGQRVLDLTDTVGGSAVVDHDGTAHQMDVTTNDLEPPTESTLQRVRLAYEKTSSGLGGKIGASYEVGDPGSGFTTLAGDASLDGAETKTWPVVKRGRRFRLRLLTSGSLSAARIRSLSWFVRDSNRP